MFVLKIVCIIVIVLVILYFLMIMPRMLGKPDEKAFTGRLYAHRGLFDNNSDAPENSAKAFGLAVEAGYGIELDVQMTSDHVPVVFHDFTLARMVRYEKGTEPSDAVINEDGSKGVTGKVCDYTFAELQTMHLLNSNERIPRFEDILEIVGGKSPLIIELKVELMDLSVCSAADKLLRSYNGNYCIESFNPLCLIWYRYKHKDVMRGQLSDAFHHEDPKKFKGPFYFILTYLMLNFLTKPDFIAFNYHYFNNRSLRLCRDSYGNLAAAWTIKSQKALDECRNCFDMYIFDSFIPDTDK